MGKRFLIWGLVAGAVLAMCPVRGAAAAASGLDTPSTTQSAQLNTVSGAAIVQTGLKYLGYRYTTVGNSPQAGFSCIGFVSYVYQSNGIALPDDLDMAMAYAAPVPFAGLLPGDILFFQNTVWPGLSHTAIYIGGGRFVHAEWYNRGVVISSFNRDPVDGNYWIGKYLGANRPWQGSAGTTVLPANLTNTGTSSGNPVASSSSGSGGASAVVTVAALNVRTSASRQSKVQEVVTQGTTVTVLGHQNGWYNVQLADGTVGWVVTEGISLGAGASAVPPATAPAPVATATAPATPVLKLTGTIALPVPWARVRSAPSLTASVVTIITQGQRMLILGRANGWAHVRLTSGVTGWVSESLLVPPAPTSSAAPARATVAPKPVVAHAVVVSWVHVRKAATTKSAIVATANAGTQVQVLAHKSGWTRVRLPGGTGGYILSTYLH